MPYRDVDEEKVIRDRDGHLVKVFYDDELVFRRQYECSNCDWTGDVNFRPNLKLCPTCGSGRGREGLGRKVWYDGVWADARLTELTTDDSAVGLFNPGL